MNPIMVVAGTRPEAIKLSPVIRWLQKLKVENVFVWSGQHYSYELSKVFFEELELPEPEMNLNVKSGSHSVQTAKAMVRLEKAISRFEPWLVVAEGDTNTVAATALTAIKSHVPFAHVEAGLRSYDRTMPEEINRIVADSCSELLFAPTELAVENLTHEGIPLRKIHLTGNTIVDVVHKYKERACQRGIKLLEELNLNPGKYLLLTLHRQESTDVSSNLEGITRAILLLSEKYRVVFPIHPRTRNKLKELGMHKTLKNQRNLTMIQSQGYFEFLGLLLHSLTVLTDSGGVQEEALTLGVPTVTLRYNTERPESVLYGTNVLAGTKSEAIVRLTESQMEKSEELKNDLGKRPNPFGDGNTAERLANVMKNARESGVEVETSDTRRDPYIVHGLISSKQLGRISNSFEILGVFSQYGFQQLPSRDNDVAAIDGTVLIRGPLEEMKKILKVES